MRVTRKTRALLEARRWARERRKIMKMFEQEWLGYATQVIPPTASSVQRAECRRAFYAGAAAFLAAASAVLDPGTSDATDEDVRRFGAIAEELKEFQRAVQKGRA